MSIVASGHPAGHRARRRRSTPHSASAAPVPVLVRRLADPRTAHTRRHRRPVVARDQRVHPDRHHQRPHRGLQPARQAGQACRLRVSQWRKLGPTDTIPLHPRTAGRNSDFVLTARAKSKSRYTANPPSTPAQRPTRGSSSLLWSVVLTALLGRGRSARRIRQESLKASAATFTGPATTGRQQRKETENT